ncbi:hypothetical protein BSL78_16693 [Apostichopus japonicus]|uniref:USP domain-containing protein n=1 Tax=Stichopus japonicus TaxID=307972 RepID=A0A2G8KEL6_STIJA|nr:hypothetical protein BSL78_16693 [Apostichopus japonicus]
MAFLCLHHNIYPEVISIGISRWGGDKLKKNFQTIDIEAEVRLSGVLYELYGVLIHEGTSSTSGHYSCAKRVKDNSWVHMNDGTCTVIAKSAIDSSNVCGRFIKRFHSSSVEGYRQIFKLMNPVVRAMFGEVEALCGCSSSPPPVRRKPGVF